MEDNATIEIIKWYRTLGMNPNPPIKDRDYKGARLIFLAPSVNEDATLTFQLTVTDDMGGSSTDQADVKILDTITD